MIKVIKIDTDELKNCKDPARIMEKIIKKIEAEIECDKHSSCSDCENYKDCEKCTPCDNNCGDTEGTKSVPTLAKQCTTCMYAHVCKHAEEASNIEEFVNERCKDYPDVFAWYYDCKLYEVDSKKVKRQDNIDVEK